MVRIPDFKITYEGVDITADIRSLISSITYSDKLEGESDDLQIVLDNSDLRWINNWFPNQKDVIRVQMGYQNQMFPELAFEVDEPTFKGVPDRVAIKAVATPISKPLRQRNTVAYENITLRAIAQTVARRNNLRLVGEIPAIRIERATQKDLSDLAFLVETAAEYGLIVKVEFDKLIFYSESSLENAAAVITIDRSDITSYDIRKGAAGTYKQAKVSYFDPKKGDYTEVRIDADGREVATPTDDKTDVATDDVLKIRERVENREQATIKAREQLRRANRAQYEGRIALEGDPRLMAGVNVNFTGLGRLSGKYQLTAVTHSITRSGGYKVDAEIKGIELTAG